MIASALATLVVVLAVAWVGGSVIAPRAPAPERLAFGALGLVGLAWATMLQGPAGVGLLGHPWALRAIAITLVAALLACFLIAYNGWKLLMPALNEAMDVAPPESVTCFRTFTSFFSGAWVPSFSTLAATISISTV